MRLLSRYIGMLFLKNTLLCLLALTALIMTEQYLGQLMEGSIPAGKLATYHFSNALQMMVQIAPPATLFGSLLTLSTLNRSNELLACFAAGVGLRQVIGIILSVTFILCCVSLVLQDRVLPLVHRARVSYYWREIKGRRDFFLDVKTDKIWYRSQNRIYNIRAFEPQGRSVRGMSVFTLSDQWEIDEVVDASSAVFDGRLWTLKDGVITRFQGADHDPVTKRFKQIKLQLGETPKDFMEIEKEVDGLRLKELFQYIGKIQKNGADVRAYLVKAHSRISLSFVPLVMALLAVPFGVQVGRRQGSTTGRDLGIALALTFFYWMFYSLALSLGKNGTVPPLAAAWGPTLVFAGVIAYLLQRKKA